MYFFGNEQSIQMVFFRKKKGIYMEQITKVFCSWVEHVLPKYNCYNPAQMHFAIHCVAFCIY